MINIADPVMILRHVFLGEPPDLPCVAAASMVTECVVSAVWARSLLAFLFKRRGHPAAPFPKCGFYGDICCDRYDLCDDAPLSFYAREFRADALFLVFDRSQTAPFGGELEIMKLEAANAFAGLDAGGDFGVVLFDSTVATFPADGKAAPFSDDAFAEAVSFLQPASPGDREVCIREALRAALAMAGSSAVERPEIILAGTSEGTCGGEDRAAYLEETLDLITQENQARAIISVVYLRYSLDDPAAAFFEELASRNGGAFTAIVR